jgi:hypothetical protein
MRDHDSLIEHGISKLGNMADDFRFVAPPAECDVKQAIFLLHLLHDAR